MLKRLLMFFGVLVVNISFAARDNHENSNSGCNGNGNLRICFPTSLYDDTVLPDFAREAIYRMIDAEVLKGTGDFRPSDLTNRAELVKIVVEATGIQMRYPEKSSFDDVQVSDWFSPYVETAKFYGWLGDAFEARFRPADTVTLLDGAHILTNAFGFGPEFDPQDQRQYEKYETFLEKKGLLPNGVTKGASPQKFLSRAEIVEQVYRFMVRTQKIWDGNLPETNAYEKYYPE